MSNQDLTPAKTLRSSYLLLIKFCGLKPHLRNRRAFSTTFPESSVFVFPWAGQHDLQAVGAVMETLSPGQSESNLCLMDVNDSAPSSMLVKGHNTENHSDGENNPQ